MIELRNGHHFEYMAASGALGFDGQGWPWEKPLVALGLIKPELMTVVLKTITLQPRKGNLVWWHPFTCIRLIPGGSVNKVGLTNPGLDWWCENIGWRLQYDRYPLVGSIYGTKEDLTVCAAKLNKFGLVALEANGSCPNAGVKLASAETIIANTLAVCAVSRFPVIAKVSADQDYLAIEEGLRGKIAAITLNSVPWKTVFSNGEVSPLWRLERKIGGGGGGVSGKPAQLHNWKAVRELASKGRTPVIAPSVMSYRDIEAVRSYGAQAVSFGAIFLRTPWKPTSLIRSDRRLMKIGNGY